MSGNFDGKTELRIDEAVTPLMEQICDGMPGGFFIYKAGGNEELIYANKAMLRIFACDTEEEFREYTGNSFKGIVHPKDYDSVSKSIVEQIAENPYKLDYVEYRIIRRDGSVRWVQDYGRHMTTSNYGEVFYVFIEDATDRMKERMEELERVNAELAEVESREQQYQAAILHNAAMFFEVDLTNNVFISDVQEREKLFDSKDLAEGSGYSDFIDRIARSMDEKTVHEFRFFLSAEHLREKFESGQPEQIFETTATDVLGRTRILQFVFLMGKKENSESVIALAMIKDITDISEKQRLFQSALSEANAENVAKLTFLSNISQDIRSPINNLRCYTELISNNASDAEILRYCVEKIRSSSKELLDTVNKALKIIDRESGVSSRGKFECDLMDILRDVKQRIIPDADEKQIHFKLEKNIRHFGVYTDPVRLEEILWQLLDNAVKYTEPGGKVTLSVSEAEDSPEGYGKFCFRVTDNGVGISEECLESIFEPLKRSSMSSAAEMIHGSGMGLAVVKTFVNMMKGTVSVESAPYKGSTFTVNVTLPLAEW